MQLFSSLAAWRSTTIMNNNSNRLNQPITTSARKKKVIDILHPGKATIPKKNSGETSQNGQDHTGCHLWIWIQNPLCWWQANWLWHDLRLLRSCKEKWSHGLANHGLYKKKKTSTAQQKECKKRMEQSGGLQRPMLVLVKRSQDSAVTMVIVQIFHERINKLKTFKISG